MFSVFIQFIFPAVFYPASLLLWHKKVLQMVVMFAVILEGLSEQSMRGIHFGSLVTRLLKKEFFF